MKYLSFLILLFFCVVSCQNETTDSSSENVMSSSLSDITYNAEDVSETGGVYVKKTENGVVEGSQSLFTTFTINGFSNSFNIMNGDAFIQDVIIIKSMRHPNLTRYQNGVSVVATGTWGEHFVKVVYTFEEGGKDSLRRPYFHEDEPYITVTKEDYGVI